MLVRLALFFLLFWMLLEARENPFFPATNVKMPKYTTNEIEHKPPFEAVEIRLPNSVRILKSVTLKCKNIDGSITSKEIPIDKAIDWHKKIRISQEQSAASKKQKPNRYIPIGSFGFIAFSSFKNRLKIKTKDRLLHHFKLVKPERIVLDFKRDASFLTKRFKGKIPFKRITLGNHKGYYRAVVELDGRYLYRVDRTDEGYLLILR